MKMRILAGITALVVVGAGVFGVINRQTYTDITNEKNFMEKLQVAELPGQFAVTVCEEMQERLPQLPIILRVRFTDDVEYLFGTSRQKICVQEVYAGDDIRVGDTIYITTGKNVSTMGEATAELGFVNIPKPDCDYLVFLSGERDSLDKSLPVYDVYAESLFRPVFCYEDIENKIVPVGEENTYVPYKDVKENEFFCTSEEGMKAWQDLKKNMLDKYPI